MMLARLRSAPTSLPASRLRQPLGWLGRAGRALASKPAAGEAENVDSPDYINEHIRSSHFRLQPHAHPLNVKPERLSKAAYEASEDVHADKLGRQQNHIWSREELAEKLDTHNDVHKPVDVSDHVMHALMYYGLYHPFVRQRTAARRCPRAFAAGPRRQPGRSSSRPPRPCSPSPRRTSSRATARSTRRRARSSGG